MERPRKVTIRLDDDGAIVAVHVDGQVEPTELVEERDPEPVRSFADYSIKRNWLAGA